MSYTYDYYIFPGVYPIFYLTKDNGVLCAQCANDHEELTKDVSDPQWYIVTSAVNWEDESLYCEHCCTRIESAYGDDEE